MERITFALSGMTCGRCVATVRRALTSLDGVQIERVAINSVTVLADTSRTPVATIVDAIDASGYTVQSTQMAA